MAQNSIPYKEHAEIMSSFSYWYKGSSLKSICTVSTVTKGLIRSRPFKKSGVEMPCLEYLWALD